MENITGVFILLLIVLIFMWIMGKAFESDLRDLEKTNPKYRKFLKDKYDI
jgi:Na+-transporting methylmalonyl-CoA/oxaloacetate decarboxylase gamma subunit